MVKYLNIFTILVIFAVSSKADLVEYTIVDLGPFDGGTSEAHGINDAGQVVGKVNVHPYGDQAFIYSGDSMNPLSNATDAYIAFGININGQVVCITPSKAYIWYDGVVTDIGTFGGNTVAKDINDDGYAVGHSHLEGGVYGESHAYVYKNGTMTDLGTLGGIWSHGNAINNQGQIVGNSITNTGEERGFLYEDGAMTDLGTLGGVHSYATDINNNGWIVGYAQNSDNTTRAYLYTNATMIDLETLGGRYSQAQAINDYGHVVGTSTIVSDSNETHGFLYIYGEMIDLNDSLPIDSGWDRLYPHDINNFDQIVGEGYIEGVKHAFLIIPEPTTIYLLVLGGFGLLKRRRKA